MVATTIPRGGERTTDTGLRPWVTRHPLLAFFAFAYAFTWLLWTPLMLDVGGAGATLRFFIGAWGPAVRAAFVTWSPGGSLKEWARPFLRWRVAPRWYVAAIGIPPLLMLVPAIMLIALREETDFSLIAGNLVGFLPSLLFI